MSGQKYKVEVSSTGARGVPILRPGVHQELVRQILEDAPKKPEKARDSGDKANAKSEKVVSIAEANSLSSSNGS